MKPRSNSSFPETFKRIGLAPENTSFNRRAAEFARLASMLAEVTARNELKKRKKASGIVLPTARP